MTTIIQGLEVPWGLAFYPDGKLIITERPGRFHVYTPGISVMQSYGLQHVHHNGEGGLLGVAIHPSNKWVYFYYTHQNSDNAGEYWNRIVRMDPEFKTNILVLDRIPAGPRHNGGRIKFGPDGYLYVGVGDTNDEKLAQDPKSWAGKILRITDEGKPVPTNPSGTEVYVMGIRNCQGITWSTKTGHMFVTSHGNIARDNVFMVPTASKTVVNFGWPAYEGDTVGVPGITSTLFNSGADETWAPSGIAYYKGSLYFGGLRGSTLYQIVLNATETGVASFHRHFHTQYGRLRDVVNFGANLYVTTSNRDGRGIVRQGDDKVLRVGIVS